MSFRFAVLLVIAFLTLGLISDADAFDGNRKGLIVGGGIGHGVTSYTRTLERYGQSGTSDRENTYGVQTDFRIGYAANEFFQIYYVNKVSWFNLDNYFGNTVTIAHGVGGLGVTYYLQPVVPSYFFTGVIGFSTWFAPFESNSDVWNGFGIAGGFGYEFARYWSVEVCVSHGNPSKTGSGISALTVKTCVNFLAY